MSTSGGNPDGWLPAPTGATLLLTAGVHTTVLPSHQQCLATPIFCPFPIPITAMGVNVTVAGGAGATVQPAIYGLAANGDPGALLIAGPVLAATAAGAVSGAVAAVIPAGRLWVAALVLAPTAPAPTISVAEEVGQTSYGTLSVDTAVGGFNTYPISTGDAALPNPFTVATRVTVGPDVWVST